MSTMGPQERIAIEVRSLRIDMWATLGFAVVGLIVFWLSSANAMALDAMYSGVAFLTAWIASRVLRSARLGPDEDNPWGRGTQENLYVMFRSLLLIGVVLASSAQAVAELVAYFAHGEYVEPKFGYVAAYGLVVAVACAGLAFMHRRNARRVGGSAILSVEATAVAMDAAIGLGIAVSLGAVALIPEGTFLTSNSFNIKATADGFVVLILSAALIITPIRNVITETRRLAGSRVDSDLDDEIELWLRGWLTATAERGFEVVDVFAVDHGGSVSIDVALTFPGSATVQQLDDWRDRVTLALADAFPGVAVIVHYSQLPLHDQVWSGD